MKPLSSALFVGTTLLVGSTAFAQGEGKAAVAAADASGTSTANSFGSAGQFVIGSDLDLSFQSSSSKPPQGDAVKSTTISVAPALDYFIVPNISVGGALGYASIKQGEADPATALSVALRAGYALSLGEKLSLWPRLAVGYFQSSLKLGDVEAKQNQIRLSLLAPVQFHPASHFFIGLGPAVDMDLSSKSKVKDQSVDGAKTTSFGVASVVGGYF